jgi:hypothetical protein
VIANDFAVMTADDARSRATEDVAGLTAGRTEFVGALLQALVKAGT